MISLIRTILVYKGHEQNPIFGPYPANIHKRIDMFNHLNSYREKDNRPRWEVTSVAGEKLVETLKKVHASESLLVIPAGQSTRLDKVFTEEETVYIEDTFLKKNGGRIYLNCGSAYWASKERIYHDVCEEQIESRQPMYKKSKIPIFDGTALGPLCPYPGDKYKVGFFSEAVEITDGCSDCTIYLSGGGSFLPSTSQQKVKVLATYKKKELERLGKKAEDLATLERAAILVESGRGAALLSMYHPYYNADDMNPEMYEKAFPNSGTDWRKIKEKLSPLDVRMQFAYYSMLRPLEDFISYIKS